MAPKIGSVDVLLDAFQKNRHCTSTRVPIELKFETYEFESMLYKIGYSDLKFGILVMPPFCRAPGEQLIFTHDTNTVLNFLLMIGQLFISLLGSSHIPEVA